MSSRILSRSVRRRSNTNLDFAGVAHGLVDGPVHAHHVPRSLRNQAPQALQCLAYLGAAQGGGPRVVLVAALQGRLDGGAVAGGAPDPHPSRTMSRMAHRRPAAGADPLGPAVMGTLLVFQPFEEIIDQLFTGHAPQLFPAQAECLGQLVRFPQPLVEQGPDRVVKWELLRRALLHAGKKAHEDLVVGVEIPLALHQDCPGYSIEVVPGDDEPQGKGLLQPEKGGRGHRYAAFPQVVKEGNEHVRAPYSQDSVCVRAFSRSLLFLNRTPR